MAKSRANELQAHREAFALSLELGCTPKEAAEKLRIQRARASEAESRRRLQAKMEGRAPICGAEPETPDQPWMMRD